MRFSTSLFPQNYLVLGGNWNLWKRLYSMIMCKRMIAKKYPWFCFCKYQDLCVRESRETFLWVVLIFPGLSEKSFRKALFEPSSIALSPLSPFWQFFCPIVAFLQHRGAPHSAYLPPMPEFHRDQPCTQGLFLLLQLKINSQLGSNGIPQNQKYVFSRLE